MSTIVQHGDDSISFVNFQSGQDPKTLPSLLVQAGDWELTSGDFFAGFNFSVSGDLTPLLTSNDARKLARWLQRVADVLDGTKKTADNKKRRKRGYDDDDEDDDFSSYNLR